MDEYKIVNPHFCALSQAVSNVSERHSISVIIPAYNRAGLIGETLRSLLNQTIPAKEIIVVDDGSTDGTADAVLEMLKLGEAEKLKISEGKPWPDFKVIRQENAGPGAARNRGLAEATGEFIHFFDSDDIAAPNKHEVQSRALLETGADIAYGPWVKGRFVNLTTEDTENTEEKAVRRLGKPSSAAFSNPSTRTLVRDCENTSSTRSESGPASGLCADVAGIESAGGNQLADLKMFLKGQSQAGLQMNSQNHQSIRAANDFGACGEHSSSVPIRDIRGSNFSLPRNFVPEGPVLQARGLPEGDLVRALLTNWSVVPHACLFRRSILERAGGFPEDIWVGEDQLLFLRCLLAGAKVVHTPESMVFYRLGDDLGKLTATGAAQKRHARDWARFLVKAQEEVSSAGKRVSAEARRRGDFLTTDYTDNHGYQKNQQGNAQGACAGAALSNPSTSEPARDSENTSPTRCASGPAGGHIPPGDRISQTGDRVTEIAGGNQFADPMEFLECQSQADLQMDNKKDNTIRFANDLLASRKQSDENPVNFVNPVKNCFGFRLRAYEAWRDLENFFPAEENELKANLERIFFQKRKFRKTEILKYQVAGFLLRKLGGLKLRVLGYREQASFQCGKFSAFGGEFGVAIKK